MAENETGAETSDEIRGFRLSGGRTPSYSLQRHPESMDGITRQRTNSALPFSRGP